MNRSTPRTRIAALSLTLTLSLSLAGCATLDPSGELAGAVATERMADNGDVITEYRVAGDLKMIKVQPSRGPAYYIKDENNDGVIDKRDGLAPVYWKLFGW